MRAISTNHFQAPVRKFILDLFDVEIGPHTLPRLAHVERGSYIQGPPHPDVITTEVLPGGAPMVDSPGEENISPTDAESRPRASSSPGREPPNREQRTRSITISDIAGSSSNTPTPKATAERRVEPKAEPPHEEGSNGVINGEEVHHESEEETHAL